MKSQINNLQPDFKGIMYAAAGKHYTKGVYSCRLGDRKFIKFVNDLAETNPDKLSISFKDRHLLVESSKPPMITIFDKIFNIVTPIQIKLFKKIQENIFDKIVYKLSEEEYYYLKNYCRKKNLKIQKNSFINKKTGYINPLFNI